MKTPASKLSARRYLITFLAVSLLGLVACGGLSVLIDPYWMFDSPRIAGVNYWKSQLGSATRTVKPQQVAWRHPYNVIIGSSTAEAGLDPADAPWQGGTYNMAYGGGVLREAVDSLDFAVHNGVRRAVFVVDFVRFHGDLNGRKLTLPDAVANDGQWFGNSNLFLPTMRVTLGIDALRDSALTVLKQAKFDSPKVRVVDRMIDNRGFRRPDFAQALVDQVGGPIPAFRRTIRIRTTRSWFPDPCRRWRFTDGTGAQPQFATVAEALGIARQNGIDLYLVIPPMHAALPLAMQQVGIYDDYMEWKRRITALVAKEGRESGRPPYPLYDFGVITDVTTERVPADSAQPTRYFTDPAHFRPVLGRMIFDRLAGGDVPPEAPEFGRQLTPETVEAALSRDQARLDRLAHREELLAQVVRPVLQEHEAWVQARPADAACD